MDTFHIINTEALHSIMPLVSEDFCRWWVNFAPGSYVYFLRMGFLEQRVIENLWDKLIYNMSPLLN